MLSDADYLTACRRYKDKKVKPHERQRYHALILVTKGYSYSETADILLVDEQTISRWVERYRAKGLDGLKNHPDWGGEHGQRPLNKHELAQLQAVLETEAMPGARVGSGWTAKAVHDLIEERFAVSYSRSGIRKLLAAVGWSYQRGRKLYIRRTDQEQARFEWETAEVLAELAATGAKVIPLAGDQTKVYLEASLTRRWNPIGQQPLVADGARHKQAENIYSALHLGTGSEVATFVIDWQDSDATIRWFELILAQNPRGQVVLWIDRAGHHTSEEIEEWLEAHPRLKVVHFPAYTPEENPQEGSWKPLKAEVNHHRWHDKLSDLSQAIDDYYQQARTQTVNFLQKFGYFWSNGRILPLPQTT